MRILVRLPLGLGTEQERFVYRISEFNSGYNAASQISHGNDVSGDPVSRRNVSSRTKRNVHDSIKVAEGRRPVKIDIGRVNDINRGNSGRLSFWFGRQAMFCHDGSSLYGIKSSRS